MCKGELSEENLIFSVDDKGLKLAGSIYATEGKIGANKAGKGGWEIKSDSLYSGECGSDNSFYMST
jgi:hypothetical protein